jgi:hypothetical protein
MLIVGVAEPIILVYVFLHEFAEDQNIPYRPWCAVTLFWTAAMIIVLALMRTCKHIHSFTRFSGELFGFLIALLFIQQGFKGACTHTPRIRSCGLPPKMMLSSLP